MSDFVLHVHELDESGKQYAFPLTRAWLDRELTETDVRPAEDAPDGEVEVRVHKQGADLVIHGHLRATLVTECARCLADAVIEVDAPLGLLLTARGPELRPDPAELELTPEDVDREFYSGERVVLDPIVREHLLLEVPIKPLCQDACPGIAVPPQVAGPKDLDVRREGGIDPRLAPLMKMVGNASKPTEE